MRCVQTSTFGQNVALLLVVLAMLLAGPAAAPAGAQQTADTSSEVPPQTPAASWSALPPPRANQYSSNEIIDAGHHFFGGISHGLASIVEKAVSQWGLPNGYILGEEASGAFIGGLRYGEGTLHTRNAGDARVFWQGPSLGFDYGADGAHTMMLVYNLPQPGAIFDRFLGGSRGGSWCVVQSVVERPITSTERVAEVRRAGHAIDRRADARWPSGTQSSSPVMEYGSP
jgi:hypothetical protein